VRLGVVRGHVVLHTAVASLRGTRLVIVEPLTAESLAGDPAEGGGKALVVADHLDPGLGQVVAFVEGREAANPYWPGKAPVDAYCSLLVDAVDVARPGAAGERH
jgi:microcompartment protein CcmK/EutM